MDCPPAAPFGAWDPILQRFPRKTGDRPPEHRAGRSTEDWSVPQSELIAKVRALSPSAIAGLRVSGTPLLDSDSATPTSSEPLTDGQPGSSGRRSAGARGSAERRRSTGSGSRTRSRGSDPIDMPVEDSGGGGVSGGGGGGGGGESADEASRRLALQLYQEEQAAFLREYTTRLTSPDNPARRGSGGFTPATGGGAGTATPADSGGDMDVEEMDESLQLAWQLQQEELQLSGQQLSGFRAPRPDGGGSPHSPHMEEEEP